MSLMKATFLFINVLIFSMHRMIMASACALVAFSSGMSMFPSFPETMSFSTAHFIASTDMTKEAASFRDGLD